MKTTFFIVVGITVTILMKDVAGQGLTAPSFVIDSSKTKVLCAPLNPRLYLKRTCFTVKSKAKKYIIHYHGKPQTFIFLLLVRNLIKNLFGDDLLKELKIPDFTFNAKLGPIRYSVKIYDIKVTHIELPLPTVSVQLIGTKLRIRLRNLGVKVAGKWELRWKLGFIRRKRNGTFKITASGISVNLDYDILKQEVTSCNDSIKKLSVDEIKGDGLMAKILNLKVARRRMSKRIKDRLKNTLCEALEKLINGLKGKLKGLINKVGGPR